MRVKCGSCWRLEWHSSPSLAVTPQGWALLGCSALLPRSPPGPVSQGYTVRHLMSPAALGSATQELRTWVTELSGDSVSLFIKRG